MSMTPKMIVAPASDLTLDNALPDLQRLLEMAATENRHGEIGVIFKLVQGKITLIKFATEFTVK